MDSRKARYSRPDRAGRAARSMCQASICAWRPVPPLQAARAVLSARGPGRCPRANRQNASGSTPVPGATSSLTRSCNSPATPRPPISTLPAHCPPLVYLSDSSALHGRSLVARFPAPPAAQGHGMIVARGRTCRDPSTWQPGQSTCEYCIHSQYRRPRAWVTRCPPSRWRSPRLRMRPTASPTASGGRWTRRSGGVPGESPAGRRATRLRTRTPRACRGLPESNLSQGAALPPSRKAAGGGGSTSGSRSAASARCWQAGPTKVP